MFPSTQRLTWKTFISNCLSRRRNLPCKLCQALDENCKWRQRALSTYVLHFPTIHSENLAMPSSPRCLRNVSQTDKSLKLSRGRKPTGHRWHWVGKIWGEYDVKLCANNAAPVTVVLEEAVKKSCERFEEVVWSVCLYLSLILWNTCDWILYLYRGIICT